METTPITLTAKDFNDLASSKAFYSLFVLVKNLIITYYLSTNIVVTAYREYGATSQDLVEYCKCSKPCRGFERKYIFLPQSRTYLKAHRELDFHTQEVKL